jgi:hypothetical protein
MNSHANDKPKDSMTNDYLWDRSGTPDPETQRLESLLSEFRYDERHLVLPAESPTTQTSQGDLPLLRSFSSLALATRHSPLITRLAAAAVVLLAFSAGIFLTLRPNNTPPLETNNGWNISNLEGAPTIGTQTLSSSSTTAKLQVGQTLTTNSSSSLSLSENDLGQIRVDPNSQLRLLQSGPNHKRIQLNLGTIHAYIWAPPTQFVVDTPSAVAIDLGCAYTLHVEPDGSGTIRTTLGWVGFRLNGRDSFIPAGAMCHTRPNIGPDTPYFEDASPAFREALENFDHEAQSTDAASHQLDIVLHEACAKDALTLWHLLSRTGGPERVQVYNRLAALVPPPTGVSREAILELNSESLDLYWNALNLGDISIWRYFERSSPPGGSSPGESSNPSSHQPPAQLQKKQLTLKQPPLKQPPQ